MATPALAAPPVPTTPARANCEAPVNIASESTHVWATEKPGRGRDRPERERIRAGRHTDADGVAHDGGALGRPGISLRSHVWHHTVP